jgi:hypothetical protein
MLAVTPSSIRTEISPSVPLRTISLPILSSRLLAAG